MVVSQWDRNHCHAKVGVDSSVVKQFSFTGDGKVSLASIKVDVRA